MRRHGFESYAFEERLKAAGGEGAVVEPDAVDQEDPAEGLGEVDVNEVVGEEEEGHAEPAEQVPALRGSLLEGLR